MTLSNKTTNRIILPGRELRLPDRDILGEEVLAFFSRYRAEFCIFSVAGFTEDGSPLEFHAAEVRAREQIMANSQTSLLCSTTPSLAARPPRLVQILQLSISFFLTVRRMEIMPRYLKTYAIN